ncbi:MAG: hypothetical protein M1361_02400, partial [Patescibacteria group bacterium]|nr:hypothetical protein [Patescibacteria group bacterium]
MNKKAIKYLTAAVLITAAATSVSAALADTNSINNGITSVQNEVNNLINIRSSQSISDGTKTAQEIAAQKKVLKGVIALSDNEISTAQEKLNNLPTFDENSEAYVLQSNYLAELASYSKYFAAEGLIISNATTSDQLQAVAADIKAFRNSGYNSEIYNMITFTLLYYDADIISTANSRLNSIETDITSLSQLLANQSALNSELNKASGLISEASDLHDQASALILQNSSSTASTTATSSLTIAISGSAATTTSATSTPDPRSIL